MYAMYCSKNENRRFYMGLIDPLKRGQENVAPSKENLKNSPQKGEKATDIARSKIPSEVQASLEKRASLQPRATISPELKIRRDPFKDMDPSKKPIAARPFLEERTQENPLSESDVPILSESLQDFKEEEEEEPLEEEEDGIGSPEEGSTSSTPDFSQDSDEERDRESDDEDPKNPLKKKKNKRAF